VQRSDGFYILTGDKMREFGGMGGGGGGGHGGKNGKKRRREHEPMAGSYTRPLFSST